MGEGGAGFGGAGHESFSTSSQDKGFASESINLRARWRTASEVGVESKASRIKRPRVCTDRLGFWEGPSSESARLARRGRAFLGKRIAEEISGPNGMFLRSQSPKTSVTNPITCSAVEESILPPLASKVSSVEPPQNGVVKNSRPSAVPVSETSRMRGCERRILAWASSKNAAPFFGHGGFS